MYVNGEAVPEDKSLSQKDIRSKTMLEYILENDLFLVPLQIAVNDFHDRMV
jgi:hypothetical protein